MVLNPLSRKFSSYLFSSICFFAFSIVSSIVASSINDNLSITITKIFRYTQKCHEKIEIIEIMDTQDLEMVVRRLLTDNKIDYLPK